MGGYATFALVRRHPERVKALVLADTRTAPDSPEAKRSRSAQADTVRREGPAGIADAFLQKGGRRDDPQGAARGRGARARR